jgi:hypothetical protein
MDRPAGDLAPFVWRGATRLRGALCGNSVTVAADFSLSKDFFSRLSLQGLFG